MEPRSPRQVPIEKTLSTSTITNYIIKINNNIIDDINIIKIIIIITITVTIIIITITIIIIIITIITSSTAAR